MTNGEADMPVHGGDLEHIDRDVAMLRERVQNQSVRIGNLETTMSNGFAQINEKLGIMSSDFAAARRPQWQALSVLVAAAVVIGGLAYWPIREGTNEVKADIRAVQNDQLSRDELAYRSARSAEDRARTDQTLRDLSEAKVDKDLWAAEHQRVVDSVAAVGLRVDDLNNRFGNAYSIADALSDLQARIDRIEMLRLRNTPTP